MFRKKSLLLAILMSASVLTACSSNNSAQVEETAQAISTLETQEETAATTDTTTNVLYEGLTFDNTKWNYNEEDGVYWQIGVVYCEDPADTTYESLGIYVPKDYMTATENADGTYTCQINESGTVNGYTASTAPIVMPVNTPGYAAMSAPVEYTSGLDEYLDSGFIYVFAGCRGRMSTGMGMGGPGGGGGPNASESPASEIATASAVQATTESSETTITDVSGAAPWGVTDLKAAVRYIRYNADILPGDAEKIITFGMSGGGAQSALMGATGDSPLYTTYLENIGAAMTDNSGYPISDATYGTMAWCPITSLDYANEAYEWYIGQYTTTDTRAEDTFTKALSNDLAQSYAEYINALQLTNENGDVLILEESENGIYASGSYYDYQISVIEESLNNFLVDTTFPYTPDNSFKAGFAGNAGGNDGMSSENTETISYATVEDYIAFLNEDETWIEYDKAKNTAKISSIEAFIKVCKNASKDVGAFDSLDRSAGENDVFGTDENEGLHFDATMAQLLNQNATTYSSYADWDASYPEAYLSDLNYIDELGNSITERQNAYNPMYYLLDFYDGYNTSTVSPYWRIRTGINQGDTAVTVESNLALALSQYDGVKEVDFATVWGQQHTTAERTGDATNNFIQWVNEISK